MTREEFLKLIDADEYESWLIDEIDKCDDKIEDLDKSSLGYLEMLLRKATLNEARNHYYKLRDAKKEELSDKEALADFCARYLNK